MTDIDPTDTPLTEYVAQIAAAVDSDLPATAQRAKATANRIRIAAEKLREWAGEFSEALDELWSAADTLHDSSGRDEREDAHEQLIAACPDLAYQLRQIGALPEG